MILRVSKRPGMEGEDVLKAAGEVAKPAAEDDGNPWAMEDFEDKEVGSFFADVAWARGGWHALVGAMLAVWDGRGGTWQWLVQASVLMRLDWAVHCHTKCMKLKTVNP